MKYSNHDRDYNGRGTKSHVHEFPVSLSHASKLSLHVRLLRTILVSFYLSKIRFSRLAKNTEKKVKKHLLKHFFWCLAVPLSVRDDESIPTMMGNGVRVSELENRR